MGLNFCSFHGSIVIRENLEKTGQRLYDYVTNCENKNAKIAKIGNPQKFNPVKAEAYTVYIQYGHTYICTYVHTVGPVPVHCNHLQDIISQVKSDRLHY